MTEPTNTIGAEEIEKLLQSEMCNKLHEDGTFHVTPQLMQIIAEQIVQNAKNRTLQQERDAWKGDAKKMREATVVRAKHGHSDTCDVRIFAEQEYPCSCGHFGIMEALSSLSCTYE